MAFTVQTFQRVSLTTGDPTTDFRPFQTFQVKVMRPNFLAWDGPPPFKGVRQMPGGSSAFFLYGPPERFRANAQGSITGKQTYTTGPPLEGLNEILDNPMRADVTLYIPLMDGYESAPDEPLNGKAAAVYVLVMNDHRFRLYFDRDSGELLRCAGFGKDNSGKEVEEERYEFSNWRFDIKFPPSTFDITPLPSAKRNATPVNPVMTLPSKPGGP
jgi:hypothetical protein